MWKIAAISVVPLLLASCVALNPAASVECRDDSKRAAENPAPDSGIDGSPARIEPSYYKITTLRYPSQALAEKITGTVYLHVWVRADRSVQDAAIARVYPPGAQVLTTGLTDNIRTWLFNPVALHGHFVASEVIVPVSFNISNQFPSFVAGDSFAWPADAFVLEAVKVSAEMSKRTLE